MVQLNAKPIYRKELKFLANSQSHLKMTKYPQNLESTSVDFGFVPENSFSGGRQS
ncbi:hypothetical protein HCG51_17985 [Tolypothrix sp. PCC 7910]|uniref:hypothetical protein n=1 Tax=Tolypothrix sp. PCC 7910 TaxID=2099387 RepID=UPI00142779B8|nr:hypothetical protein [Tolypothrix sp. PCC 7910]QIR38409.1 hypothetical protein HCG51_17985 [Tolypothrix sp. PCC 7910]